MKNDWLIVLVLALAFSLFTAAVGAPFLLGALMIISGWLRAIPGPSEHWASLVGDLAWPAAMILIVWWLRHPIEVAVQKLAERLGRDDVELAGFLKVTARPVSTLDIDAATEEPDEAAAADVKHVEGLLEYAAESHGNVTRIVDWIEAHYGLDLDTEAFFYEPRFAKARETAYREIVEGQANG